VFHSFLLVDVCMDYEFCKALDSDTHLVSDMDSVSEYWNR